MITATLSSLPGGRDYEALGVVIGTALIPPPAQAVEAARRQMELQAEDTGADAVIDVRLQVMSVSHGGPRQDTLIALSGTAIKLT